MAVVMIVIPLAFVQPRQVSAEKNAQLGFNRPSPRPVSRCVLDTYRSNSLQAGHLPGSSMPQGNSPRISVSSHQPCSGLRDESFCSSSAAVLGDHPQVDRL